MSEKDLSAVLYKRPGYLLRRIYQIAEAFFMREAAGLGITSVQYGVMQVIDSKPGIDQLRLSRATRWDRTTISGVIRRLEQKNLIKWRRNASDRRSKALFLTDAGRKLLKKMDQVGGRSQERLLSVLPPEDRRILCELLAASVKSHEEAAIEAALLDRTK